MGKEGEKFMYHYIKDKEFLGRMKNLCSDIMNQLKQQINNDSVMQVDIHLVGSGAKNLITQNANEPIDLDYNLCILKCRGININDGETIKEYIREQYNIVLDRNELDDCHDSKSVLTSGEIYFTQGNPTRFSIDLAITHEDKYNVWHRLIHEKTGFKYNDKWFWNETPHSKDLTRKVKTLKNNDCWLEVRKIYLEKKNMYLRRNDHNHPSFIVYIETINEVYGKYFR